MFARRISLQLKPNTANELAKSLQTQVIPALRSQKGFQDELLFVGPGEKEAFAISLWDTKENAEVYDRNVYPEIAKILARIAATTPQVQTYDVMTSTIQTKHTELGA